MLEPEPVLSPSSVSPRKQACHKEQANECQEECLGSTLKLSETIPVLSETEAAGKTAGEACCQGHGEVKTADIGDELNITIRQLEFGDSFGNLSDVEPPCPLPLVGSAVCLRGSMGVKSLSLSDSMLSHAMAQTAQLQGTLSSESSVHGASRKWVRGETIGHGSLGNVFQALDQSSGQMFAVKEVLIDTKVNSDIEFKDALENELRICSSLKHPSIVTYLGHDWIDSCLYVYLEYMIGGSMAGVLKQFGAFEEDLTATYTSQLIAGLTYLHTQEPPTLHRDIKSSNVLMGQDPTGTELCAKLADFGCSKRNDDTLSHTLKGSIPWLAPEVVRGTGYGRPADIWSFGCVLIEMGSAQLPWGKLDNPMQALYKIGMSQELPEIPQQFSEAYRDFAAQCLQRDPALRPSARDLLQHSLVQHLKGPGDC